MLFACTLIQGMPKAQANNSMLLFGVCKNFLELQIRYPHTLRINKVIREGSEGTPVISLRFSAVNGAGALVVERMDCQYEIKDSALKLTRVEWNKQQMDQTVVDRFNPVILAYLANPPDLELPAPLPNNLYDLYTQK